MSTKQLLVLSFFAAFLFLANVSVQALAQAEPKQAKLTPEQAKEALLRMMRSKEGKEIEWFKGDIPDQMAKLKIEEEQDGWHRWTGAYRINPAKAVYSLIIRPEPGARACIFEYEGSFASKEGVWIATPPKLIRTILQSGK